MITKALNFDPEATRRTLLIVLVLNVALAIGFLAAGYFADSSALLANGLDNASDAVTYVLTLLAMTRQQKWKRGAARFSGIMLVFFSVGVAVDAGRRFLEGSEPVGITMLLMAAVAGGVNLYCLWLLKRLPDQDVSMRAATTFSFNDFAANGGIVVAGFIVLVTGSNWPDLVVGIGVACIAFYGGIEILRDAHQDIHAERGDRR